ncbi:MAG: DUF4013 domain-containing protein [Chloroflexota bacterium]|nr:DUF4013 domain-containing protein [Chloroflexota bacterium]
MIGGGLFLLGYLTSIILIGIPIALIVFGYLVQVTRNVIAGQDRPLPEWNDWGGLLRDGFRWWVATLVLFLPLILIALVVLLPGIIVSAGSETGGSDAGALLLGLGYCLLFPLILVYQLLMPVITGRYATAGSIGAAVRPGALFSLLRANLGGFLIVLLLTTFVTSFVGYLGILACGIGLPFTVFYALLVNYHLYGQAYRKAQGTLPAYGQPQQPYPPSPSFPY